MEKCDLRLLAKFGAKEHMESMLHEGVIYCNPIKYFLKIEDGQVRGDELEAVYKLLYVTDSAVQIREADKTDTPWRNLKVSSAQYKEGYSNVLGNIFCMSAFKITVTHEACNFTIDKRFKTFGEYYLLIQHQDKFLERIKMALNKYSFPYEHGVVEYVDFKKFTGAKSFFQKGLEYSYQEEFRIHLLSELDTPFSFSIGSIADIAEIYRLEDASSLQLKLP